MKDPRGIASVLFLSVLVFRPHLSGSVYPFSQGLFLIPLLVGLGLMLLSPETPFFAGRREDMKFVVLSWLLGAWALVTLIWTPDPGQGVRESMGLLLNLSAFTMAYVLGRDGRWLERGSGPVLGLVVVPVLAVAFYQRIFGLARIHDVLTGMAASGENVGDLMGIISHGRVFAGFLNPNMLAGFLAIVIPLTLDLGLTAATRRKKAFFYTLTAAEGTVLLFTGSMGGTLVAGLAAAAVLLARRGVRQLEVVGIGTAALFLIGGLLVFRGIDPLLGSEGSLVQRMGYMSAGVRMALVHPLAGWGSGSSPGALMAFVAEGVRPVADPHNFIIRIWTEWGAPGLLLLGGILFLFVREIVGKVRTSGFKTSPGGFNGCLFGAAAFFLHGLVDMGFFVPETALFGWCALGAVLAFPPVRSEEVRLEKRPVALRRTLGILALIAVLPALVFLQGESVSFRGRKAAQTGDFKAAADLYREARRLLPFNGRFALEEGRAVFTAGDRVEAVDLFHQADHLMAASPYPPWEMGRAAQAEADWKASLAHLERAGSRYPTSPRILIDLARSHLNLGDIESAQTVLEKAARVSVFDPMARELAEFALDRIKR